MSYYYNYYIGYEQKGKIYPLGPYDCFGKLKDVISRSHSIASDLHEDFYVLQEKMISEELRKEFSYKGYTGETQMSAMKYLPFSELPSGRYIKTGYFLIEDVERYENDKENNEFDCFFDCLSPTVYAARFEKERIFGPPAPKKDDFGGEYDLHPISDYMYYAYPDHQSKEYEAFIIRTVAYALAPVPSYDLPKDASLVVLETEG